MKRLLACALLAACACAPQNPQREKRDRTFDFVERTLTLVGRQSAAALAFSSQVESGGTTLTYLAANMPDGADFCEIADDRPKKPWTLVVRPGPGKSDYTIEAYGSDLAKPERVAVVDTAVHQKP